MNSGKRVEFNSFMTPEKGKNRKKKSIRVSQRQHLKLKYAVAAGSLAVLTVVLILYFNLSKNEVMKAGEKEAEHASELPSSFEVEQPLMMPQQPEMRGVAYKPLREEKHFIH